MIILENRLGNEDTLKKSQQKYITKAVVLAGTLALASCGGGNGGNNGGSDGNDNANDDSTVEVIDQDVIERDAVTLSLSLAPIKTFSFSWDAIDEVDHYVLMENADGSSGFSAVSENISGVTQNFDFAVPLYKRTNAQYILQTCYSVDDADCVDSNTVSVNGALVESIGYFKSDRSEASGFGNSVALSADGNTLAVGAWFDSYGGTGINPSSAVIDKRNSGAVYVFTRVNNVWSKQAYLKATANTIELSARYGQTLSLSDDGRTLAVGAKEYGLNLGAVYVYALNGDFWGLQNVLYGEVNHSDFGNQLTLSGNGDTLAITARIPSTVPMVGKVFLYIRANGFWNLQTNFRSSELSGNSDLFGFGLALNYSGSLLAISAPTEDSNASGTNGDQTNTGLTDSGAVFIYEPNYLLLEDGSTNTSWTQAAYIKADVPRIGQRFGRHIDFDKHGRTLAVGGVDDIYMFTQDALFFGASNWIQQATSQINGLTGTVTYSTQGGISLSDDGNTLVVGAPGESSLAVGIDGDQNNQDANLAGAVYVYTRTNTIWMQKSYIKASNTSTRDYFSDGLSISGDGNTIAVGARGEDSNATGIGGDQTNNSVTFSGAVYLY